MIDRTHTTSVRVPDLVRLGRPNDGGYAVPRSVVEACDGVVGLGVHDDWSFEADLRRAMPTCRALHLYDPTTTPAFLRRRSIRAIPKLITHALTFDRARLREDWARCSAPVRYRSLLNSGARHFHEWIAREDTTRGHTTRGQTTTGLRTAIERAVTCGATRVAVKMDIEGAEYDAFDSDWRQHVGQRVGLLVVEFHDLDRTPERFNNALRALTETFLPVHLHGNSGAGRTACGFPAVPEITFVHRDLLPANAARAARHYPIAGLDQPTHRGEQDLEFTA